MNSKLLEFLKNDLISKNIDVNQSLVNLVKNHRKLFYIKKIKLFPYPDLKECKKYIVEYYKITKPKNNKSSKIQTVKVKTVKVNYYDYIKSK